MAAPILRSSPLLVRGIPVFLEILRFASEMPKARFREKLSPGIFIVGRRGGRVQRTDNRVQSTTALRSASLNFHLSSLIFLVLNNLFTISCCAILFIRHFPTLHIADADFRNEIVVGFDV